MGEVSRLCGRVLTVWSVDGRNKAFGVYQRREKDKAMTKKEKVAVGGWMAEISLFEQDMRDFRKELGEMFISRGGDNAPTISMLEHFDYLQTHEDRSTRNSAKIIWIKYHEAKAQIDSRQKLGQLLADIGTPVSGHPNHDGGSGI